MRVAYLRGAVAVACGLGLAACDLVFGASTIPLPPDAPPTPTSRWASVTAGALHTCGIRLDGTLWCWGRNDLGELGTGTEDLELDQPVQVGTDSWSALTASSQHTCGLKSDATLWCWGENDNGELGINSTSRSPIPAQVAGTWTAVATGRSHTCAIDSQQAISCWGSDSEGELGDSNVGSTELTPVKIGGTWSQVIAGGGFTCAVSATDQSFQCWGNNGFGQFGDGTFTGSNAPKMIGTGPWDKLTTHDVTTCGIAGGKARCWGKNESGQLGNDATSNTATPVIVSHDDATWTALATGNDHTCGLHTDGSMWCWGANRADQLAADTMGDPFRANPVAVSGGPYLSIALGDQMTCAIDGDHQLWCAGLDGGQLGTAAGGARRSPVRVGSAIAVATGNHTTCAISDGAGLRCWGFNGNGSVGDGSTDNRQLGVAIPPVNWSQVAVGDHTCAINNVGGMKCWGRNNLGQLGNNSTTDQLVPVAIPSTNNSWASVIVNTHTCAIDDARHLSCWGDNTNGKVGQNPQIVSFGTPQPLQDLWVTVGAGDEHSCGVTTARIVECWGSNDQSQLGNGSIAMPTPTPTPVPGFTTSVDNVVVGGFFSCALSAGTYSCWGRNEHGELGNMSTSTSASPVAIGMWSVLSAGEQHACGIRSDGSLACWGNNDFGQLGDGTLIEHHEPVAVGTNKDWATVSVGVASTCAAKSNITHDLYCWGRNLEGQVGDGAAWRTTMMVVP